MKTFLIIILVLSILANIKSVYEFRTLDLLKDRLTEYISQFDKIQKEDKKISDIFYWIILGVLTSIKIALLIMLIVTIA